MRGSPGRVVAFAEVAVSDCAPPGMRWGGPGVGPLRRRTQRTPPLEIESAKKRLKELIDV